MTPRQVLRDPDRAFTFAALRAHQAWKRERIQSRIEALPPKLKSNPFQQLFQMVSILIEEA